MEDRYYRQEANKVLQALEVDKQRGLSTSEAKKRLEKVGPNTFTPPKEKSLLQELGEALTQQLIVILLIASGVSLLIGEYDDAMGICFAVLLGITIGLVTESKSRKASEALSQMVDDCEVKVLRDGQKTLLSKKEIVPGDIIFLEGGDRVPADGRILEAIDLKVREDMLTGESDDVKKRQGIVELEKLDINGEKVLKDPIPAKQYNMLFGGTLVACGQGCMVVTQTGDHTEMGNIAKELGEREEDTPLQIKMNNLGAGISKISTAVAAVLFVYMFWQIGKESHITLQFDSLGNFIHSLSPLFYHFPEIKTAFVVCVALIVAAVPEGLNTMINITLAIMMKKMASIHILVRKKEACETIGSISVICSDKTGTLTQNKMQVAQVYCNGQYVSLKGMDCFFIENCVLNSTADLETTPHEEKYIGSATEGALLHLCKDYHYKQLREKTQIVYRLPFQSQTKFMVTTVKDGSCYKIFSKGAPEVILEQCRYEKKDGRLQELTAERRGRILYEIGLMQGEAMRVLAFAYGEEGINPGSTKKEKWNRELIFNGFVAISDPIRPGVKEAVACAAEGGIETKMLTGDNLQTAIAIGKEIGIVGKGKRAVEASYIEGLSEAILAKELETISIVARSKPDTKLRIVKALQKAGEVVAVTGDGINDAPALTKADVGIAMGIAGTEVSKNAADIILTDDSFGTIVEAIKWGRGIYNNFQRFIQFQLTVNVIAFMVAILTQIMDYPMPFTTIQLLCMNIIMDGPPALVLGLEPIRETVMKRKPIARKANIINQYMIRNIIVNGGIIITLLMLQIRNNFLGININNPVEAQTALFSLLVFSTLFNALNCREFGTGSIFPNLLKNKWALWTIGITLCMHVMMVQWGKELFSAAPLSLGLWLKIVAYASLILILNEGVKWILRTLKHSTRRVWRQAKKTFPALKKI
ncbi:calcium-translocating P-type ATPase, PMCA-type [Sporanaerobium hydrogeniformans]|uniref:Calcium-translocating P-type ATPase, PMCA-type n=1 Tax=Sporanaerobium hydrogeniformans TaxID=3072179 RepID=A0AC61DGI5_9FIRM|nr:calcium-translocating P-type ATPase, PMCA-type [Sporanaerobium hydrogeniformans]PHV71722.1 calcium-translocating P-type ATPase, PMCA-type [Sporanaerobium hydrogeniformans]